MSLIDKTHPKFINFLNNKQNSLLVNNEKLLNKLTLDMLDDSGNVLLNDSWVLWYHDSDDTNNISPLFLKENKEEDWKKLNDQQKEYWNWHTDSYIIKGTINNLADYFKIITEIPSTNEGMWFLMRKGIFPLWEDPHNINGGAYRFKIHKKESDKAFLDLSMLLIGESMCESSDNINGISISPKKQFSTLRVWLKTTINNVSQFDHIKNIFNFKEALFIKHKD